MNCCIPEERALLDITVLSGYTEPDAALSEDRPFRPHSVRLPRLSVPDPLMDKNGTPFTESTLVQ